MMSKRFILFLFMTVSSCSDRGITNNDIDKFISKYQGESFSDFMNVSISYRDSDFDDDIYMVAKQGGDFPPYVVRYNKKKKEVANIDNKLLKQSNCGDYFSDNQIKDLMTKFVSFNIQSLSVDSSGNVFINPFYTDEPIYLLRLKTFTGDSTVRKGYVYELYKEKWYLNKTRRKS